MELQAGISARRLKAKIGRRLKVIVDAVEGRIGRGRSEGDAPEIDGAVHFTSRLPIRPGQMLTVKIERADAHDLFGTAV
jgi:ribosomal protein S12 methylthiotransferase